MYKGKTLPYSREGKIESPITDEEFNHGMEYGKFLQSSHEAYCVLLFYSAVRKTEGLRTIREQFTLTKDTIYFEVGQRLKHSKKTPTLPLSLNAPYMDRLKYQIDVTLPHERVFPFSDKTAYNVVRRAFKYPHLFRLSRITWFFSPHPELNRPQGFSIGEVVNWTGLSLAALDYYLGLVVVAEMGRALGGVKR